MEGWRRGSGAGFLIWGADGDGGLEGEEDFWEMVGV